jgi:hypothetical protein
MRNHVNTADVLDGVIDIVAGGGATSQLVAAPTDGKRIRLLSYVLTVSAATTVQFKSAATAKSGVMTLATGVAAPASGPTGRLLQCASNEALNLTYTVAGTYGGHFTYQLVEAT